MEAKIRKFLTVSNRISKPGFTKLLGTEPDSLLNSLTYFHNNDDKHESTRSVMKSNEETYFAHTIRYKIPHQACVSRKYNGVGVEDDTFKVLPLSGYFALFDDFTTLAIATEDVKTRPGVSISLSTHWGSEYRSYGSLDLPKGGDDVDFKIRVIKIGNILGFAEGKAICCKSGNIIAQGNHIKYLPGSIVSEFILGPMLPVSAWIASLAQQTNKKEDFDHMTMDDALDFSTDDVTETNTVDFEVQKYHQNPWGTLHGGCQAMLMESIGSTKMKDVHADANDRFYLDEMQINYMSVGKKYIKFIVDMDGAADSRDLTTTRLNVKALSKEGKSISEGLLTFKRY